MNKRGISLVGVKDLKTIEKIRNNYSDAWFELAYNTKPEQLNEQLSLVKGRVASMHLLCPIREYFPNIAYEKSYIWSENEILKDAEFAAKIGAEVLVLHPGYVIDGLVFTDNYKRMKQIASNGTTICTPDYPQSEQYQYSFSVMTENAVKLSEKIRNFGLELAIENLNPRVSYLVMKPEELLYLASLGLSLNLDTGHLQLSSALFKFDYYKALEAILNTGKVVSIHLHSNESCNGIYDDSHCSLDKYLNCQKVLDIAEKSRSNLIIESIEDPLHNISLLFLKTELHLHC